MSTEDITKPKLDKRSYKVIELPNKLRVFLIHDPEADKSACALDVGVGCALDPKPLYGTAHFLEHMLFQGSKKYPKESEYMDHIKNNGGMCNAYTSLDNTNYHFNCSNEAFEESLDRISQFFISPNFSIESADKEVKAVDSEYNMSLQTDAWHYFNLVQHLSEPDSNLNRFNCGNVKTLQTDGMRDSLLKFHKTWYSANIMNLAVVSRHPIDKLEQWTTEKFSAIENFNVDIPNLNEVECYPKSRLGQLVKYVPVKDVNELKMSWILPSFEKDIDSKPLDYFSHLFGHEGENSLLSYLKEKGLALELSAGGDHELGGSFSTFEIGITLSDKGLENYYDVVEAVFHYAHVLKSKGPQEWVYEEIRDLGNMNFEFQNKGDALRECVGTAKRMKLYGSDQWKNYLREKYVVSKFDKEKI